MPKRQKFLICGLLIIFFSGCDERDIMHGLSEREANSLISRLGDSGIEAEKLVQGKDTWSVQVKESVASRAIKIISRSHSVGEKSGGEDQGGLFLSKEDRRFQLARSLARDIEQTLVVLSGVHEAKVHLKFPDEDPLLAGLDDSSIDRAANDGSGSALVIVENDELYKKEDIANLVSGASGIPAERIAVWLTVDKVAVDSETSALELRRHGGQESEGPVSLRTKPVAIEESGISQSGLAESFRSIRIVAFESTINFIKGNLRLVIGVVLLVVSIFSLIYIRITRVKAVLPVIPSYIP
jgi:type III secretory pathway lipoprotein EscJ